MNSDTEPESSPERLPVVSSAPTTQQLAGRFARPAFFFEAAMGIETSKLLDQTVRDGQLRLVHHLIAEASQAARGDNSELIAALEIQRRILNGAGVMLEDHMKLLGWRP